jgi:hypothetical protein
MRIEYPYSGTKQQARQKVDALFCIFQTQYVNEIKRLSKTWNSSRDRMDFDFRVYGCKFQGNVQIQDGRVVLETDVPDLLEEIIKEQLEKML